MSEFAVVIPTFGGSPLLQRTLASLADCEIPRQLSAVIVVENGPKHAVEGDIRAFRDRLPLEYGYSDKANKSIALNSIIEKQPAEFLVFLDDDIRAEKTLLSAYATEIQSSGDGRYLAGPVDVDYEEVPPEWLTKYLPASAIGWGLGQKRCKVGDAPILGANWGAFTKDLNAAGGFDGRFGPGSQARGQERNMQKRLNAMGVEGIFLPDAKLFHYVPKARCSEDWVLNRRYQEGVKAGLEMREHVEPNVSWRLALYTFRRMVLWCLTAGAISKSTPPRKHFERRYYLQWYSGVLKGYFSNVQSGAVS